MGCASTNQELEYRDSRVLHDKRGEECHSKTALAFQGTRATQPVFAFSICAGEIKIIKFIVYGVYLIDMGMSPVEWVAGGESCDDGEGIGAAGYQRMKSTLSR
ncbi:hypothetical protein CIHG_01720 [Coccidioides immitis H538.4]|uniref:Uncharacterized protein n=3 Tax=Coccidioides immitis TaxID=5501 RepID=A0A0J8R5P6_COCIT|nr:hypothetical protein CIRG_06049 [Coccidioides immitis RMSCC 2394]KMU80429.1 hypothetical protein CISG_02280 [Coccidioides immitis RMSCC 3703]KMU83936.1 hypothetical protein CIHG_01720 [Coccidioides immitis H538.4]